MNTIALNVTHGTTWPRRNSYGLQKRLMKLDWEQVLLENLCSSRTKLNVKNRIFYINKGTLRETTRKLIRIRIKVDLDLYNN